MKKWKILFDCTLLCCLFLLISCRFSPFNSSDYGSPFSPAADTIAGLTPEQVGQIVEDIKNNRATLPVSLEVPAYSFYRFDYSNAAGAHRGSTILSYDQAVASPPYGIETTARVLAFEAMKARAGHSINFFTFSDNISKVQLGSVINAIATKFADNNFLLSSSENIGSATLVAQAVNELVNNLPIPAQEAFVPVPIASPAINLDLKPDFSDLPETTLTKLFLNEELHEMYASMTVLGLANYSLFQSNVPAVSQPRPSFRLHSEPGVGDHDIRSNYSVCLAPVRATASVAINPASSIAIIPGVATTGMDLTPIEGGQRMVFTYYGDRAIAQTVTASSEKLTLDFTYRNYFKKGCESSKNESEGPIVYLNRAGPQNFSSESTGYTTQATRLQCVLLVNNLPIATFTAEQGTPSTVDLPIPVGQIGTLSCYVIPPSATDAEEAARAALSVALASGVRELDTMETAAWNKSMDASSSVVIAELGRKIFVPTMFMAWFRPLGTFIYESDPTEFTPQVFRGIAAPASPVIALDMSRYSETPIHAFSIPICVPMLTGISSGFFNSAKTFSIEGIEEPCEYSLDNGVTWNDFSGPVTISDEGIYQIVARSKVSNLISQTVTLTIDTTSPLAPTIADIASGTFKTSQTFTVTAAETGGTLYYSLDGGLTSTVYTGPVTISEQGIASCTAWQIDSAGNAGEKAVPVVVIIDTTAPLAPTIADIASGTFMTSQTFTVTAAETGGTLYYSLDGGLTSSLYTGPVTISTHGIATCTAWQVDLAGNIGEKAAPVVVIIDNIAPLAPTISGITAGTFATSRTFTVTGAETGGTLHYSLDDSLTSTIYTGPVVISNEGTYICTAWQIDTAGNTGPKAASITFTIDFSAPQPPTIEGLSDGTFYTTKSFSILAVNGETYEYSLDNGTTWLDYTGPVTVSNQGSYQIVARNKVTNLTSTTYSVSIDLTSPQPPTVTGLASGTFNSAQSFSIQAVDGRTYEYSLDNGTTWLDYSGPVTVSSQGSYQIVARVKGTSVTSDSYAVTIDTTAPLAPTITGITAGIFTTSRTFTVTAAESGDNLYYSLDDGLTSAAYTGPVTITQPGTATCTAWQVDAAGNVGTRAAAIVISILEPSVTAILPANGLNSGVIDNIQITGSGFSAGVVPYLTRSGQTAVTGSNVTVESPTSLTCSFDLTNMAVGSWSVLVTYPDGGMATGTELFLVQSKSWRRSFGGTRDETDIYSVNVVGGGFLLAGTTNSDLGQSTFVGDRSDIWVARLDNYGTLLWSKCFGGSGSEHCSGLIAFGGGYVLVGDTNSIDGDLSGINSSENPRAVLLKIDANGSLIKGVCPQTINFPIVSSDARGGVKITSDGGCIMAGRCSDGSYGYAWAVKFNSSLVQGWEIRLTGNGEDTYALDVAQKDNGNYLLCGYTDTRNGSFSDGTQPVFSLDGFVAEIAYSGEPAIINTRCFGGSGVDSCSGVVPLPTGDFCVIGTTGSTDDEFCPLLPGRGTADVMTFMVSADFSTVSSQMTLGGSGHDTGLRGQLAPDNGLLFSARTASNDGTVQDNHSLANDFWFGKINQFGSIEWQKCFGGTDDDFLSNVITTPDGDYLLSGYGLSTDGDLTDTGHQSGNHDFIVIREAILPTM